MIQPSKILGSWIFILLGALSLQAQNDYTLYYQQPVHQFKSLVDSSENPLIVDVRTSMEYKKGHIKGAVNVSYLGFGFKKRMEKLDLTKDIYIYCQSMHRSPLAAKKLASLGYENIYDLEGGFKKWEEAGFEVVK